jgi:hypothetical protein
MNARVSKRTMDQGNVRPIYHSRVGVMILHELREFLSWRPWWMWLILFFGFVPITASISGWDDLESISMGLHNFGMMATVFAFVMSREEKDGTLEPLLATGVRRWEIVAGKFIVGALLYSTWVLTQLTLILVIVNLPAVVARHAFLLHFHPNATLVVNLVLVLVLGGLETIALGIALPQAISRRAENGEAILGPVHYLWIIVAVWVVLTFAYPNVVLYVAACPWFNMDRGVDSVFTQYSHMHQVLHGLYHDTMINRHFLPAMYAASCTVTALSLFMVTRRLTNGR